MKFFKLYSFLLGLVSFTGCVGNMSFTGGNSAPNYPFFITTEPLVIKKIAVPIGTKLIYEEQLFKKGEQDHRMSEEKLTTIELTNGKTIDWGGVPVTSITKFFNTEMHGFTVTANFAKLKEGKKTKFSKLWQSCDQDLGITVGNTDDWSFNTKNILDVESCSVIYQRYFKDDANQQSFLDSIFTELRRL